MAKITIEIEDQDDGAILVRANREYLPFDSEKRTTAEIIAAMTLKYINMLINGDAEK
jgi:hypothetical protein